MSGAAAGMDHAPFDYDEASAAYRDGQKKDGLTTTVTDGAHPLYDPNHPDDEYPTEEELATLERHPDRVPLNVYLIGIVELCERLSYYGCSAVYTNFIQQPLPAGSRTGAVVRAGQNQAGALGQGQRASTGLVTFNSFWNYVTPLFGGWIADAHLGRFNTILYGIFISITGHIILIISSLPPVIAHPQGALGAFSVAIVIIGIGTGGFKPNVSPLIAEQVTRKHVIVRTTAKGQRYLIDPGLTTQRIFIYFYGLINIGAIVGQVAMVYAEKRVGFWLAYTVPTLAFLFSPLIMLAARKRYAKTPAQGSVLGKAFKIVRMVTRGTFHLNPIQTFREWGSEEIWDKAKPSKMQQVPANVTWDDAWVDQVRRGLSACIVFVPVPIYWVAYNQILNNLLSQAATMQLHGVPNDLLQNLDPLAIIIMIPIFDQLIYPAMRKLHIRTTPLRRMFWGFMVAGLAMICATVTQYYIYKLSPCGHYAATCDAGPAPINVWAQTPTYVLIGMSEIFTSITGLEYAYTKAPTNMRSMVTSIWLFMTALGNAINEALVSLSTDPLLIWNYAVAAILVFVAGSIFWLWFRGLDKKEERFNAMSEGHVFVDHQHEGGNGASSPVDHEKNEHK